LFEKCKIEPIFLFDGAHQCRKIETKLNTAKERIDKTSKLKVCENNCNYEIAKNSSMLASEVFIEILSKYNICYFQCYFEADYELFGERT
jgi:hypothetical protein